MSWTEMPPCWLKLAGQQVVGLLAGPQVVPFPRNEPEQDAARTIVQCVPLQQAPVHGLGVHEPPAVKTPGDTQRASSVRVQAAPAQQCPSVLSLVTRTWNAPPGSVLYEATRTRRVWSAVSSSAGIRERSELVEHAAKASSLQANCVGAAHGPS